MQGPWDVETACLGMRRFCEQDIEELIAIEQNDEFMKAVRATLKDRTSLEPAVRRWKESGAPAPLAIALKHTGQVIGIYVSVPLHDDPEGDGFEGVFVLKSEEYSQGFASELAQASLDAVQKRLFEQSKSVQGTKASYSLRGSITKRIHGAAVMGFKFIINPAVKQA